MFTVHQGGDHYKYKIQMNFIINNRKEIRVAVLRLRGQWIWLYGYSYLYELLARKNLFAGCWETCRSCICVSLVKVNLHVNQL